jgi:hypothetical protein
MSEIPKSLAAHGATAILSEYDAKGHMIALSFKVRAGLQELACRLLSERRLRSDNAPPLAAAAAGMHNAGH